MAQSKKRKPAARPVLKKAPSVSGRRTPRAPAPTRKDPKAVAPPPVPAEALVALTSEVAAVKARLLKEHESAPLGSDEEYDALRRLINELLDRRMERVVRELVEIRNAAGAVAGGASVAESLETLLARLGAVRFDAQRLDHVDPLIHAVSRETRDPALADGVIAAALRSGFRTARGVILARAQVAVNRRD